MMSLYGILHDRYPQTEAVSVLVHKHHKRFGFTSTAVAKGGGFVFVAVLL